MIASSLKPMELWTKTPLWPWVFTTLRHTVMTMGIYNIKTSFWPWLFTTSWKIHGVGLPYVTCLPIWHAVLLLWVFTTSWKIHGVGFQGVPCLPIWHATLVLWLSSFCWIWKVVVWNLLTGEYFLLSLCHLFLIIVIWVSSIFYDIYIFFINAWECNYGNAKYDHPRFHGTIIIGLFDELIEVMFSLIV